MLSRHNEQMNLLEMSMLRDEFNVKNNHQVAPCARARTLTRPPPLLLTAYWAHTDREWQRAKGQ